MGTKISGWQSILLPIHCYSLSVYCSLEIFSVNDLLDQMFGISLPERDLSSTSERLTSEGLLVLHLETITMA